MKGFQTGISQGHRADEDTEDDQMKKKKSADLLDLPGERETTHWLDYNGRSMVI